MISPEFEAALDANPDLKWIRAQDNYVWFRTRNQADIAIKFALLKSGEIA
jgi:hypothetical protein